MKNDNKIIPIPEVRTVFPQSEITQNSACGGYGFEAIVDKNAKEEIFSRSLIFTEERRITHYLDEYPIVEYRCDENRCFEMDPTYRLNSFVESVRLSIADAGKRYYFDEFGVMHGKYTGEDIIAYYVDTVGDNHVIEQNDIVRFLFQKPQLAVSPDGMLVFYTEKKMLATLDLYHYCWIDDPILFDNNIIIKEITVTDNGCEIDVVTDTDKKQSKYQLNFEFDFTQYNPIDFTLNKIEE